jgi:predicted protein tyrosine phosphatase
MNSLRSPTAAFLYSFTPGVSAQSAGTKSDLSDSHLDWVDLIFVMEKHHRHSIRKRRPDIYAKKKITCLYVDDVYDYCSDVLISVLADKLTPELGPPKFPPDWETRLAAARAERSEQDDVYVADDGLHSAE